MTAPWERREPPYIIAEIGVNHDGDVSRAIELTDAADDAGASAIKLQCFSTDHLMSRAARLAAYQRNAGERDPFAMLRRLELTLDEMAVIVERAQKRGVDAIVTVFSVELVSPCADLDWTCFKSASPDIIHRPLLEAMAATGRPLIVSTGAATLEEVERAAAWLRPCAAGLAFLQCVSSYPTPPEFAAIGAMASIAEATHTPVGYSDHTASTDTGAIAVQCGARILEKHLTYDCTAAGPDHAASLDPDAFATYVTLARQAAMAPVGGRGSDSSNATNDVRIGTPLKSVLPVENDVRRASRQSIVTMRELHAGDTITSSDVTFKRPGSGIEPWRLDGILGRHITCTVEADTPLTDADLA